MSTPDAPYTPTNAAAFVCEPTEHHWISSHEPNAPIWIIQCSLCGRHNFEEMLAAHDAEVKAAAVEALLRDIEAQGHHPSDRLTVGNVITKLQRTIATYRTEPSND